jgi:hypothetical protein
MARRQASTYVRVIDFQLIPGRHELPLLQFISSVPLHSISGPRRRLAPSAVRLSRRRSASHRRSVAACSRWNRAHGQEFITMGSRTRSHTCCPACPKSAGAREENLRCTRRPVISFMSPPSFPIWKSTLRNWSRFDGLSCEALRRRSSSTFRTTPGRKQDVFWQAAFTDLRTWSSHGRE